MGLPASPKPPIRTMAPSKMSATASAGEATRLSIMAVNLAEPLAQGGSQLFLDLLELVLEEIFLGVERLEQIDLVLFLVVLGEKDAVHPFHVAGFGELQSEAFLAVHHAGAENRQLAGGDGHRDVARRPVDRRQRVIDAAEDSFDVGERRGEIVV